MELSGTNVPEVGAMARPNQIVSLQDLPQEFVQCPFVQCTMTIVSLHALLCVSQ